MEDDDDAGLAELCEELPDLAGVRGAVASFVFDPTAAQPAAGAGQPVASAAAGTSVNVSSMFMPQGTASAPDFSPAPLPLRRGRRRRT